MSEKEAYEQWYANYKRHLPNRPTAKHGWQAGVEWQKAQAAEPVAEITQDGKLKLLNVSALDFGTKLYTHPAPAVAQCEVKAWMGPGGTIWRTEKGAKRHSNELQALCICKNPAPAVAQDRLLGAIARGWCSERNKHKVMDADLAHAIAEEINSLLHSPAVSVNEQLAASLKKANDQAEHFEREWYLRGDEIEGLKASNEQMLETLKSWYEQEYGHGLGPTQNEIQAVIAKAEAAKGGVRDGMATD